MSCCSLGACLPDRARPMQTLRDDSVNPHIDITNEPNTLGGVLSSLMGIASL